MSQNITKRLIERFEHTLLQLEEEADNSLKQQTRIAAVRSEIEELTAQLEVARAIQNTTR